jgi:hypothetical protein
MSGPRKRRLMASMAAVAVTLCRSAAANDPATATMLFNEAKRLVASGRYSDACPKFEESQRLDPGIGTQYNLADCYEHTARTATAWALFLDVASAAGGSGQEARENVARKRAAALEPTLSKLTIDVPKDVVGMEVRRSGDPVAGMVWNMPVPVDPGVYRIDVTAPGRKAWSTLATVGRDGETTTVAVPELEIAEAPAAPGPETSVPLVAPPVAGSSWVDSLGGPQNAVALALGGGAIVSLGVGSFFGVRSIAKHSDYERDCSGTVCSVEAAPIYADAVSAGNVSTVAFIAGFAMGAAGAALWFTAPKHAMPAGMRVGPIVGSSTGGVSVVGDW